MTKTIPLTETVRRCARLILSMLAACTVLASCSIAPVQYTTTDMLDDDEKYSPLAKYFVIDDTRYRNEIVSRALGLVGTDYRWGGNHPDEGLDCSGLVTYVVEQSSRRSLPHHAATIALMTRPIKRAELAPGDLVFFNTLNRRHSHVGVYIGDGRFVHSPTVGQKVRIDTLSTPYYAEHLDGLHTFERKAP